MDNPPEETPLAETPPEEPAAEEPVAEIALQEETDEGDTFHARKNVLRLASWANIISWIVVIIYLILFTARLYYDFQGGGVEFNVITALTWISYFSTLLIGVIWFVILQGFAEGLYLLLDIFDKQ